MTWSYDQATERALERYEQTSSLVIADVTREIDFDLISRTKPRRVTGTHFYVDVTTFNQRLRNEVNDDGEEMLRLLHIFAREASKIVSGDFDGQKVHFQGPRLHALSYRPVSDESMMTAKAVLTCLALRHMTAEFNAALALTDSDAWKVAAGLDHGRCIATRNGAGGDQELLFLGSAANHAAKLLQKSGIRLTSRVRDFLPDELLTAVEQIDVDTYRISLSVTEVEKLAAKYGWNWSAAESRRRLDAAAQRFPVGYVTCAETKKDIDKSKLTVSQTKRVSAASIFADVDGFTAYIDGLKCLDTDLVEAIRLFHVLRGVMRDSAVQDFNALRVQYQGDRMQTLAYKPVKDDERVALDAVRLAAALMTVADEVVPAALPELSKHRLAIGLSWGQVLVSRIGEHGHTDVISLGNSTANAATIQQRLDGGEIGIDGSVRDLLPGWAQSAFSWSASAKAFVAIDLTYNDFADLEASEQDNRALKVIASQALADPRQRRRDPIRPWSNQ